ncbi:hypothetical protein [Mangrovibacterium diazotrophicum]|uniref:Uncharacterized protein n=1 Tax=Mangrovibacterium diazotrophicum TaxID=1261403 RepID=A0A419W778_9BACT|nr:hypothetical protein [Mangrovibacterium diazotrophicum]RKD91333.1 hypothetical protein BC643_1686 [Mangrovibacterium diazotrophicum]
MVKFRMLLTLFLLAVLSFSWAAQNDGHYLFPEFKSATIFFKTGLQQKSDLNFNKLTEEMVFVENGKFLAIANVTSIDSILIAQRKFIPVDGIFFECEGGEKYPLFVQYKSKLISAGKSTGFGNSQTTAVDNISNVYSSGKVYELEIGKDYRVLSDDSFWTLVNEKYGRINSLKEAQKIFPDKNLKPFVKANKIKFDNSDDLLLLLQQVDQIK